MVPATSSSGSPTTSLASAKFVRLLGIFAFVVLAALLCSVTVRHLAAAATTPSQSASAPEPAQQLPSPPLLANQMDALRSRVAELQNAIGQMQKRGGKEGQLVVDDNWPFSQQRPLTRRQMAWQPMKRMVQWQPVKRDHNPPPFFPTNLGGIAPSELDPSTKEQVVVAIEQRLAEVLEAGERLGVSADHILAHLRARNGVQFP